MPIHDTDVAEERWAKNEWRYIELWEKIEQRLLKKKRFWVIGTVILFLILSSVSVLIERLPKWESLNAARKLAIVLNDIRKSAATQQEAYQIEFLETGKSQDQLTYRVRQVSRCENAGKTLSKKKLLREGTLIKSKNLRLLKPEDAENLGIPGLVTSFCYDAIEGSRPSEQGHQLFAFGLIPVKDLAARRADRVSVVLIKGASAEISFN